MKRVTKALPWVGGVIGLSVVLSIIDGKSPPLSGFLAYLVLLSVSAILVGIGWVLLNAETRPRWLIHTLLVAFILRLIVGVTLTYALPRFGYDSRTQQKGYVFYDAFRRDRESWSLAGSSQPLVTAFTDHRVGDQYGGMLYLSALIYRTISPDAHRSLLIVVLTASVSALAVFFTWGFSSRIFGSKAATLATWTVALFPDAILLGSSQMREPLIGTAIAAVFYGYALLRDGRLVRGLSMIFTSTAFVVLPLSPPYAIAALFTAGLGLIWERRFTIKRSIWLILPLAVVSIAAIFFAIRAWSLIGNLAGSGIGIVLEWWKSAGAQWQQDLLAMDSLWIRQLFDNSPAWAHIPLIIVYGLVQPFLPGALMDGVPLWRGIGILRSLGWFALLPFLIYAPLAAIRKTGFRSLPTYLCFLVWVTAILASYRGAGDQWDNPRYRAIFLVAQAAILGWAWVNARRTNDPWLQRTAVLVFLSVAIFTTWYAGRNTWLSNLGVLHVIVGIAAFILVLLSIFLLKDFRRRRSTA